ncbi:MAG TPA: phosphoenolpyruvate--protein phosphotransferase [Steroidobacteraceae bacterium]|nr:phosphoenolpyruvate--protein phosphotransferase [Steroidobacteraceae bacterium]
MTSLKIIAPFDGWCAPLDEVPDPVFAGRLLGDGLAIDPTSGIVTAPCDGEIITLPPSGHAVSIRSLHDVDVLIHIGIDTVHLGGRGFDARVKPGARVRAGDELIRFDLDVVARGAKSLMTPIVVTSEGAIFQNRRGAGVVRAGELLFEVSIDASRLSTPQPLPIELPRPLDANVQGSAQQTVIISLRQGLHARPAALLARRAKSFGAQISLEAHGRVADARSVVAIMALGVRHGDEVILRAEGNEAAQALDATLAGLEEALRLEVTHESAPAQERRLDPRLEGGALKDGELSGVAAVPGFAVGRATRIARREFEVTEQGSGTAREREELDRARSNVRLRLERVRNTGGKARQEIIAAHLEFLDDPTLNESAHEVIAQGKSAGYAWRQAIRRSIAALELLDDSRLRERADDLLDVEAHVLLALAGEARPMHLPLPEHAVLLADDLLPSELTALDSRLLVAIALSGGGATSHVAILAAAMEIPMLIGLGGELRKIVDGQTLIVDADGGTLFTAPTAEEVAKGRSTVEARLARSAALRLASAKECRSLDGTRVEIFANLGSVTDAVTAVASGAEGCGLLRTEFLFIDRETPPTEDEQLQAYQSIAKTLGGRPLILRMMDVGGDKPLRYLPLPVEANPALGLRGVRTALLHPNLMRTQLRAALRVQPFGVMRLLIPMITDLSEILAVRQVIDELAAELKLESRVTLGAMIETPSAALTAAVLIRAVDFLSIGSNDLTQYTLAMDRGHAELARRTDALHPAVLQLIAATAVAGDAAGKLVAVCGGVAADRTAVPILLGLGIRELSVVPAAIPALKRQIGGLRIEECRELAKRCLQLGSASEVRGLIEQAVGDRGESS